MRSKLLVVVLLVGCEKKEARFDGPLPVTLGDCAGPKVSFVSGPRPLPFTQQQAEGVWIAEAEPPNKHADDPPPPADPDPPRAPGQHEKKVPDDPRLARQQAIEQARTAGILGSVDSSGSGRGSVQVGAFASLVGTGDISSGFDDQNIYGGLLGNEAGEMNGGFGFGRSGFGPGGSGTGWGTIGTGRYGTIGHGSGTGSGYGVGGGRGGMRGRSSAVPTVSIGQPNAAGDLDKAIIRRYIKRNIAKISYCYEKQLLAKPKLAGTVQTQFFIDPNGKVASSTGSGVDPEVASCIASVIKDIQFPKPKSGGGVQVNYPFTLRPADGSQSTPTAAGAGSGSAQPEPPKQAPPPPPPPKPTVGGPTREIFRSAERGPIDATGYAPGAKSPLAPIAAEITECLRKNPKHDGVGVVELAYGATGGVATVKVHGIDEESVRDCIVEAATRAKRVDDKASVQRCPFAFGSRSASSMPALDITADAVSFDGKRLTTTQAVGAADAKTVPEIVKEAEARVQATIKSDAVVAYHDPIVLRPIASTPMKIVVRAISSVLTGGDDLVLAANRGGEWRLLSSIALPGVPVPYGTGGRWNQVKGKPGTWITDDERVVLSIYVTKEQVWLGMSRINEFQPIKRDALVTALKEKKTSAYFTDRDDFEIAGDDEIPYGDIVDVIDGAASAGFTHYRLTDPAGLAARPTL